jgi:hypothetical protein
MGSVLSVITVGIKFGDAALVAKEFFRTDGAKPSLIGQIPTKKNPLLVRFLGQIVTAFDGTAPAFTVTETNLDDSGSVSIAAIAGYTAGLFSSHKFLTVDKKYKLTYTIASAGPTAGEAYFSIWVAGPGLSCIY